MQKKKKIEIECKKVQSLVNFNFKIFYYHNIFRYTRFGLRIRSEFFMMNASCDSNNKSMRHSINFGRKKKLQFNRIRNDVGAYKIDVNFYNREL